MFEGLFKSERALARHRDAPLAEERSAISSIVSSAEPRSTLALEV